MSHSSNDTLIKKAASGISADQYTILSGDDSGAFSITASGDIRLEVLLNFEIQPGYLLEIEMQNSSTGETESMTLAVFLENDPTNDLFPDSNPPVGPALFPSLYTADTIIDRILVGHGATKLPPA